MPTDAHKAAEWLLPKVIASLGEAKLWPVRLSSVKYAEKLRFWVAPHALHGTL